MSDLDKQLQDIQDQQGGLDPQGYDNAKYNPNKRRRAIRREVYERWYWLRDDPNRLDAEADWEIADKEYGMVMPETDPSDWRAHLQLPDAFSAIQTQAQETIERRSRPTLISTEETDEPVAEFSNSVLNYNMNNTGYDYQFYLAKLAASIRGTAFLMDYWRTEKRIVKQPKSLKEDGTIEYETKEIIDFDDDYTEWVPNEFIYVDEKAKHIDEAIDMFRREILNIDEFHRKYGSRPDFFDVDYVVAGGETSNRSYFRYPSDITAQDVEVLHYYNRSTDSYWVVANNVTIHDSPLPWQHKELPLAVVYQYKVPGLFWGMGIPKIIHALSEERKSIRNLNLDRQKMQLNKMFLHNSSFDIDDEDLVTRPHGLISVDTNGQPLSAAIQPIEYGDVQPSYFRTEEILLQDMRRATGIEDRLDQSAGGTATEAAIKKESILKRVNLISTINEIDAVVRIGRLKWANIQFFYPIARIERIASGDEEKEEKVYRTISVSGKKFRIESEDGKKVLKSEDVKGNSALTIKNDYRGYLEMSYDVTVDADVYTPPSKAIEQTKKTELFTVMIGNPATMSRLDLDGSMADILRVNNVSPSTWMKQTESKKDMMMLADTENVVMASGQPLDGTPNATEDHTLVHLMYTRSGEFQALPPEIQQLFTDHILQEHDANPATGSAVDAMAQAGLSNGAPGAPGAAGAPSPGQMAPLGLSPQGPGPQAQVADIQPANFS